MPTTNSVELSLCSVPGVFYLNCQVCGCLVGRWTIRVFVSEGKQCMSVRSSNISFPGKEGDNLKETMTFWKEPQGNFNSHRTQSDQRNCRREMAFLALPTADLHFEVSYSQSGIQEPGCYLHSNAMDITNSARPRHTKNITCDLSASYQLAFSA